MSYICNNCSYFGIIRVLTTTNRGGKREGRTVDTLDFEKYLDAVVPLSLKIRRYFCERVRVTDDRKLAVKSVVVLPDDIPDCKIASEELAELILEELRRLSVEQVTLVKNTSFMFVFELRD